MFFPNPRDTLNKDTQPIGSLLCYPSSLSKLIQALLSSPSKKHKNTIYTSLPLKQSCHDLRPFQGMTSPYQGYLTSKFLNRVTISQDRATILHPANLAHGISNRVTISLFFQTTNLKPISTFLHLDF